MTVPAYDNTGPLVVLVSTRAVLTLPDNSLVLSPATICISPATGKIEYVAREILPQAAFPPSTTYVDHSPKLLLPGLVDAHVHLNEPGRTEWEGFHTGTRAAASGGVTTVVDMPLNAIPPTTTIAGFNEKLAASQGQCWVDVGFYGGVIPGNADQLLPLVEAGVRGFKGFLIESGVEAFPAISSEDIARAMTVLRDTPTTFMFHAEMIPPITDSVGDGVQTSGPPLAPHGELDSYRTFEESRPPAFETYAVEEILSMANLAPNLHLHIVHLSATECIPILREARARGVNVTAETCFHYLGLASDGIEDGDTRHKCCPPIRGSSNQDGLWTELTSPDSCIRTVVSDHSPCTPELKLLPERLQHAHDTICACADHDEDAAAALLAAATGTHMHHSDSGIDMTIPRADTKSITAATTTTVEEQPHQGDFFAAWGGISSVGLGLPILHSAATARRQRATATDAPRVPDVLDVVRLCSQATAAQVGLSHRKGGLRAGLDGDVCVFDDEARWVFSVKEMRWRNRCSPWEGHEFTGRVEETWLRGQRIFERGGENGGYVGGKPVGRAIIERRMA